MIQDKHRQLYYGYAQKVYTLPDGFVKAYEKLAAGATDPALVAQMTAPISWGAAQQAIVEHLQPALAAHVAEFTNDVTVLGRFAGTYQPDTIEMLRQPEEVRTAYLRHIDASWYMHLRNAWRILRGPDPQPGPLGCDSLLSEISNPVETVGDGWMAIGHHVNGRFVPTPWEGNADWLRLSWLIRAGGRVWMPTAAEQATAYRRQAEPEATAVNPAARSHSTTTLER